MFRRVQRLVLRQDQPRPALLAWPRSRIRTRYSGARAPARPDADPVTQEAYSHEVIGFGFWPGDEQMPGAELLLVHGPRAHRPSSDEAQPHRRDGASETVGRSRFSRSRPFAALAIHGATLHGFLQSAYEAGATAAGWDMTALESSWCPTPEELSQLAQAHKEVR